MMVQKSNRGKVTDARTATEGPKITSLLSMYKNLVGHIRDLQ